MPIFALILISIGTFLLASSMKPACTICKKDGGFGWKILLMLIALFLLGYLSFFFYLLIYSDPLDDFLEKKVAMILFGGSLFVKLVIHLSLKSIDKIQKIALKEEHSSLHDSLTGLANRKYFLKRLNEKVKLSKPFSLFVIDINRFKQINDMLGHYVGTLLR